MTSKKIAFEEIDNKNSENASENASEHASDNASENASDNASENASDNDENDFLGEMIEENNNEDLVNIFQHFFTNDDGENIADILTGLKKSVDLQNKILHKVLNAYQKQT